jgi:hypothetical protein
MQVPRFSPRISLIEMAPRAAPHSGCPGRPALPLPCLSPAPQGTGSDWKNLPGTAQFLSTQTEPGGGGVIPRPCWPPPRPVVRPAPPPGPSSPVPPSPARAGPPAPCFTGLSLPPPPRTLHKERAVTGRNFQELPTRTDRRTDRHCNFNI